MMEQPTHMRIAIDQAGAGMVLADDLLDGQGKVLPQGSILTDATLSSLRRRGVAHCTIVPAPLPGHAGAAGGDAGATAPAAQAAKEAQEARLAQEAETAQAARAAQREHQLARLRHLFRHSAGLEANATLLQLLTDYRNRE